MLRIKYNPHCIIDAWRLNITLPTQHCFFLCWVPVHTECRFTLSIPTKPRNYGPRRSRPELFGWHHAWTIPNGWSTTVTPGQLGLIQASTARIHTARKVPSSTMVSEAAMPTVEASIVLSSARRPDAQEVLRNITLLFTVRTLKWLELRHPVTVLHKVLSCPSTTGSRAFIGHD